MRRIEIKRINRGGKYYYVARDTQDGQFLAYEKWSSNKEKREKAYIKVLKKAKAKVIEKDMKKYKTVWVDYTIRKKYKAKQRKGKGRDRGRDLDYVIDFSIKYDAKFYRDKTSEIDEIIVEKFREKLFEYFAENFNWIIASEMVIFDFGVSNEDWRTEEFDEIEGKIINIDFSKGKDYYGFEDYVKEALDNAVEDIKDLYEQWLSKKEGGENENTES